MRKQIKIILLFLLLCEFIFTNCVPAAIIAGAMATSSSKKSKQQWTAELQKVNLEREKAGLKQLDWCEEAFKFKKSWALKDRDCKEKLKTMGKI